MGAFIDITGKTFSRLTAVAIHSRATGRRSSVMWRCVCSCGNEHIAKGTALRAGEVQSCGCLLSEVAREKGARMRTHGMTGSPTYTAWVNMKNRCANPLCDKFYRYGGRGIVVCERWASFENFLADMGEKPAGMSIDRIDPNGNYEPANCRWATQRTQQNNRANNVVLTVGGESMTLANAARLHNIDRELVRQRLGRGWDAETALRKPARELVRQGKVGVVK